MIMNSRSIKFNRLDRVDDVEECVEPSNVRLWQYIFVSCWTENPEESIPLWRMYSGTSHGVRIGLDTDMFEDNIISDENIPPEIPLQGFFVCKVPAEDLFRKDYFVSPIGMRINDTKADTLFYCHVKYVDDVKEKTRDAYQFTITDETHTFTNIAFGEIGKYKNKRWAFQEESRFRLLIFPFNPLLSDPNSINTIAGKTFYNSIPVPISEYYLKLRSEHLSRMEITLHPNATESDRVIVKALCAKYAPAANVKDSELMDRVKMK